MENVSKAGLQPETLKDFFTFFYENESGYVYLAFKDSEDPRNFQQEFFEWPKESDKLIAAVQENFAKYEVYFAPALFSKAEGTKDAVKGSYVLWAEFDDCSIDVSDLSIPEPSLRIQSSDEKHQHWYWKLQSFCTDTESIESINRGIAYFYGADPSGWDISQILRPPNTVNHKRSLQVKLIELTDKTADIVDFSELPDPPPLVEVPDVPEKIPSVEDVIAKYEIPIRVWRLFKRGLPEGKRSDGLMSLGYSLAEIGLRNDEILSVLYNADERWGKFKGRADQLKRLSEIVTISRQKYPEKGGVEQKENKLESMGLLSVLRASIEVSWVWRGLLHDRGYMLLTGPSGVGKSQLSLDAAAHFALGKDFLGRQVSEPQKVGFFSLEMGLVELKHFLTLQAGYFDDEELELLEKNLRFFPLGEPIYLNRGEEKQRISNAIQEEELKGIFVDSLGSTTEESLSAEKDVKSLMDWNDAIRNRLGIFSWFIHHHRKATSDNKKPNKLSDVYGNQYITARATSVLCLWDTGAINSINVLPLKVRLSPEKAPFNIYRDAKLHFTEKKAGITIVQSEEKDDEKETTGNGDGSNKDYSGGGHDF